MPLLQILVLTLLINSASSSTNTTDLLALLSFKSSISTDLSKTLASWNQTARFCEWHGVVCARKHPNRVTSLSLNSLGLVGTVSPSIANLSYLRVLKLGDNQLQGLIPRNLGSLSRLVHLNLSYNSLSGEIPPGIANCSFLRYADLSNNMLQGAIPADFSGLSRLVQLVLYSNELTGLIPTSFGNLSSLAGLVLAGNDLDGSIPDLLGSLSGLKSIQLAQNRLSGTVPASIYNLSSLYALNLGGNQLSGSLPSDIGSTLPSLQSLAMYGNRFDGPIPLSLANVSGLQEIMLDNNSFTGPIPPNFGALRNLSWLVLSRNQLEAGDGGRDWMFLDSLTNCSNLVYLELYRNDIRGALRSSIANLSTQLSWLTIGHNRISGTVPPEIGSLVGLDALFLEENLLAGPIPDTIGKLGQLQSLWLFDNKFSGEIPSTLGNLTQLNELYLEVNELEGAIPTSLGNLRGLIALNASYNNLSGEIPKELVSLSSLSRYLDLAFNSLTGVLPAEVGRLINLKEFNVSNNRLSGEIPGALGQCKVLEFLYMDSNFFYGAIPRDLMNLKGLQELNLSRNNLSGPIPEFLQGLKSLRYLNLSFNYLEGEVPTGGVFANATASSIVGNDKLCGGNTELRLQLCSSQRETRRRISALGIILSSVGAASLLCLLVCVLALRNRKRKTLPNDDTEDMYNYERVPYAELYAATDGFSASSLIGVGSYGSVYRGTLERNGEDVAVKVLNLQQKGASKSFVSECGALKNMRHRNLVKVLTACSSVDFEGNEFKALVYEFLPNGSLDEWLHPKGGQAKSLSLLQRLSIAVDVAAAFAYLHHDAGTEIVHCDLKPSNVLLDEEMVARVGDFGLATFLSTDFDCSSLGLKGSIGYIAPEYGMGRRVWSCGDVYSYGILLLEMLTGLRPTGDEFKDGWGLRSYVRMSFPDRVMEIIDRRMVEVEDFSGVKGSEIEVLVSAVRIGLACSEEDPRLRMDMRGVYREMSVIQQMYLEFVNITGGKVVLGVGDGSRKAEETEEGGAERAGSDPGREAPHRRRGSPSGSRQQQLRSPQAAGTTVGGGGDPRRGDRDPPSAIARNPERRD